MSNNYSQILVDTSNHNQLIDITQDVRKVVKKIEADRGVCYVYVPHTTAGVSINENADPDVRTDIIKGLSKIVPDDLNYDHAEGNSPSHIKTLLTGSSVSVIIENGDLVLGTWQGIYFCEYDGPRSRKVYVKVISG